MNPLGTASPAMAKSNGRQGVRALLLGVSFLGAMLVWGFREPLQQRIVTTLLLRSENPSPAALLETIQSSPDVQSAILNCWNTGRIVHRQVAIAQWGRTLESKEDLVPEVESALLAATVDPDMNVREKALSILMELNHSALPAAIAAQLNDVDPELRLVGLRHLRRMNREVALSLVGPALDDPNLLVAISGVKVIEQWSGEDFGVKLSDVIPAVNETTGLKEVSAEDLHKAQDATRQTKLWLAEHSAELPFVDTQLPASIGDVTRLLPASDFRMKSLDGQHVRLLDQRGKVVIINFWTTWCSACISEIPVLVELHNRHSEELVILGVSLDAVPDSHGHVGGHGHDDNSSPEAHISALDRIRAKVARTVAARGINYTILLDEDNELGGRFNGGELPTTVIIDPEGLVRRRFMGARDLETFEAMIAEAAQPWQLPTLHSIANHQ